MKATGLDEPNGSGQAFGRYRLLGHLSRGGMADVYKAKSFGVEGFEKTLVIKKILPELAVHQEFVDMFVQEAKLAVRLSHANIVQVFDLGRIDPSDGSDPSYFIAMEYVDGVDLAAVLRHYAQKRQPLPLGMAVFVATEVAKALDHAHRRRDEKGRPLGIVHRDVSPHNVLLSWDGDVKVADFGIAKAADAITRDDEPNDIDGSNAGGKLPYTSPEQARGDPVDHRSDLFSLGVVLYELVVGENPFLAASPSETVRRICAGEYAPVHLARADASEALTAIVDRLLTVLPEDRLGSAAELCEQLLTFSYESGERFGAAELAALLVPLRGRPKGLELEAVAVLADPTTSADKTPVEIPQVHPSVPPERPAGEREHREVTALVLSFGRSGARIDPEALSRAKAILARHGALLLSADGEHLCAIFGTDEEDGRDTETAVRAALVLVRERIGDAAPRAGIHSGPIALDDEGSPVSDERLTAMLETARALARGDEGQVAVSHLSGRLVRRSFVLEPLPLGIVGSPDGGFLVRSAQAAETLVGRFVGRHAELKSLGAILAVATRRKPQLVVVTGDAGIGKSRFLAESKRRLERGNFNVACYQAACPIDGASIPWSGLRAMLHVLCGTQEDDPPQRIADVRPRLRALALGDDQSAVVLALLGASSGFRDTDGSAMLRSAFEHMLVSLTRDRLHCLAWDDAQHMDRDTLDSILKVMRHPGGVALTTVLAMRGDPPELLRSAKSLHVLTLGELSESENARLLESQLGARAVPPDLLLRVRALAGGHPMFVDELLRELTASGVVRVLSGKVTLAPDDSAKLPRTIEGLVTARLDRLGPDEQRVLQAAAILGSPAFTHVLAAVLDEPLPAVDRHLSGLGASGLLRRAGPTKVRFVSPLYRDLVLQRIPEATRRELHARAAAIYDRAGFSPAGGDAAERVAMHLHAAGDRKQAVDYYWRGARQKLARGQLEPAIRSMLRALEVAELAERAPAELVEWIFQLAEAVTQVRAAPGLRDVAIRVAQEVAARGDASQRAKAYIDLARALGAVNLFDDAYQALDQARAATMGEPALERAALCAEIIVANRQGLFVRSSAAADKLEKLGPIDDVTTLLAVAWARGSSGQPALGHKLLDRVDALCEPSDALEAVARQKQRSLLYFDSRDYDAAAREARQLAKLARAAGLRYDTAAALHNLGDVLDRLGDHARAYAAFLESLEITRLIDHERLTALNQMHLCLLDGLRNVEGAGERLESLVRFAESKGYLWDVVEGRFLVARLAVHNQDYPAARKLLTQVVALADEQGDDFVAVDARALLASLPVES